MKDRMGWAVNPAQAGFASAQARVTGDTDAQKMLELLARAHIIGAGNLPNAEDSSFLPPLTGPPNMSGENPFDKQFAPETLTEEPAEIDVVSPLATETPKSPHIQLHEPQLLEGSSGAAKSDTSDRLPEQPSRLAAGENANSPPMSRPRTLKRTMTDTLTMSLQDKLMDTMAQPFIADQNAHDDATLSPNLAPQTLPSNNFPSALSPAVHGHTNRWVPAAQAIFTTESKPPFTILAANDLACLVFGVTKAEVRKMGILEVVQEERRDWLKRKLLPDSDEEDGDNTAYETSTNSAASAASALLGGRSGITAKLLSKPNSRASSAKSSPRRAQTVHSGDPDPPKIRGSGSHRSSPSRGVLLCGDVVPIQKRNGATGSASLWVKEKRFGLIWVLEEIHEDVANIFLEEEGVVKAISGATVPLWGMKAVDMGTDIAALIPRIPRQGFNPNEGEIDYAQANRRRYFTCPNRQKINIPCTVEQVRGKLELRVSTFPHMAGIIVIDPANFQIKSSNSAFCGALFGFERPDGMSIDSLIPGFDKIIETLTEEDGLQLLDGMVIPEHRFRRAAAFTALKERRPDAAASFLQPDGLPAKHRDGSDLKIDVQMRVVESEKQTNVTEQVVAEESDEDNAEGEAADVVVGPRTEMVFALWITYSRHLHAPQGPMSLDTPAPDVGSPLHQPSPGQTPAHTPDVMSDSEESADDEPAGAIATKAKDEVGIKLSAVEAEQTTPITKTTSANDLTKIISAQSAEPLKKRTMSDFVILEDMGQGAYGQVKLARNKITGKKVVLKYVTKRRILVDTWTRDRKLGTVPLEIHVLNYLRKPEFRHPNIVEMEGFFEDDVNYYIEMAPHGLPGMDLFDYIELRANMEESECRTIFVQVAQAIHFLHTKALVVHRDIKDENVILDGEGTIKIIDFGSAAYIKSGPFDVFVGTIDYAAPEVLAGKPYGGKEQDVWALGILLYTIIYKENPFYSIDEIMDRDLRVPYTISEESIDLIRHMLDRDVEQRYDIAQVLAHPWCKTA